MSTKDTAFSNLLTNLFLLEGSEKSLKLLLEEIANRAEEVKRSADEIRNKMS